MESTVTNDLEIQNSASQLWEIYLAVSEWVRIADSKAATILGTNGIIVGLAVTNPTDLVSELQGNIVLTILAILATVSSGISIYYSLDCLKPIFKASKPKNTKPSLIYFRDILKHESFETYFVRLSEFSQNDRIATKEIGQEIWMVSRVAARKHDAAQRSLNSLVLLIFLVLLGFVGSLVNI